MSKVSKSFQAHIDAIANGIVTKTNVVGLRRALNNYERIRHGWSPNRDTPIDTDEMERVTEMLGELKPRVTGELHDTGKTLLQNKRYRRQLESVAEIVADIDHFKLIGFDYIGRHSEYAVPVYRAYDTKGKSFPFRNVPWQSGGNGPEILSANYW